MGEDQDEARQDAGPGEGRLDGPEGPPGAEPADPGGLSQLGPDGLEGPKGGLDREGQVGDQGGGHQALEAEGEALAEDRRPEGAEGGRLAEGRQQVEAENGGRQDQGQGDEPLQDGPAPPHLVGQGAGHQHSDRHQQAGGPEAELEGQGEGDGVHGSGVPVRSQAEIPQDAAGLGGSEEIEEGPRRAPGAAQDHRGLHQGRVQVPVDPGVGARPGQLGPKGEGQGQEAGVCAPGQGKSRGLGGGVSQDEAGLGQWPDPEGRQDFPGGSAIGRMVRIGDGQPLEATVPQGLDEFGHPTGGADPGSVPGEENEAALAVDASGLVCAAPRRQALDQARLGAEEDLKGGPRLDLPGQGA